MKTIPPGITPNLVRANTQPQLPVSLPTPPRYPDFTRYVQGFKAVDIAQPTLTLFARDAGKID